MLRFSLFPKYRLKFYCVHENKWSRRFNDFDLIDLDFDQDDKIYTPIMCYKPKKGWDKFVWPKLHKSGYHVPYGKYGLRRWQGYEANCIALVRVWGFYRRDLESSVESWSMIKHLKFVSHEDIGNKFGKFAYFDFSKEEILKYVLGVL